MQWPCNYYIKDTSTRATTSVPQIINLLSSGEVLWEKV